MPSSALFLLAIVLIGDTGVARAGLPEGAKVALGIKLTAAADSNAAAIVDDIAADGPGYKAGIRSGDTIVSYDGTVITSIAQLSDKVARTEPGATVSVEVKRAQQLKVFAVNFDDPVATSVPYDGDITVALSDRNVFEAFDALAANYGYTFVIDPRFGNAGRVSQLSVGPLSPARAFQTVTPAYGACAHIQESIVTVMTCK
jgi:membrane-associated protease RseP (regulator of RpoE activity)